MISVALADLDRLLMALRRAGSGQYDAILKHLHDFIRKTPRFAAIVSGLEAETIDFDPSEWLTATFSDRRRAQARWPDEERHRLRAAWHIIEHCVTGTDRAKDVAGVFSYETNFDVAVRAFSDQVVLPVTDYIRARLVSPSVISALLLRYAALVEWFDQGALYDAYVADSAHGERGYDRHLRRFLFESGIDYPFSEPVSASGKADVVAGLDTSDPLVCEMKLYDGNRHGVPYIAKGLRQAVRYAHDYRIAVAHLVVINLTEERLDLPSDAAGESPPARVVVEGVTVNTVVVQARPLPSASKDRRTQRRVIARDELVGAPIE